MNNIVGNILVLIVCLGICIWLCWELTRERNRTTEAPKSEISQEITKSEISQKTVKPKIQSKLPKNPFPVGSVVVFKADHRYAGVVLDCPPYINEKNNELEICIIRRGAKWDEGYNIYIHGFFRYWVNPIAWELKVKEDKVK